MDQLSRAMDQIAKKGGRESLILRPDAAFVVSVPNRTVITAMGRDELKDNVFTQIDSAVMID
jgi:flagellar operon protein